MTVLLFIKKLQATFSLSKVTKVDYKAFTLNAFLGVLVILAPGFFAEEAQTTEPNHLPVAAPQNIKTFEPSTKNFEKKVQQKEIAPIEDLTEDSPFYDWNRFLKYELSNGQIIEGYKISYDSETGTPSFDEDQRCQIEILDRVFLNNDFAMTLIFSFEDQVFNLLPEDAKLARGLSSNHAYEAQVNWSVDSGFQSLFVSYLNTSLKTFRPQENSSQGCVFLIKEDLNNEFEPTETLF